MYLLGIIQILFFFDLVASVQQLRRQATYSEVNPNGEAVLDCIVENKGGSCVWQKDRRVVGIYTGKYEWAGDTDSGDCSLRILQARTDLDDGVWECQVTATSFDSFDTVNSEPIPLVVRAPPNTIRVTHEDVIVRKEVTVTAGDVLSFTCTAENGNPAPELRWFLGDKELQMTSNQTDVRNGKRWSSKSELIFSFTKSDDGKMLSCEAVHPAVLKGKIQLETRMNVQYAPIVTVEDLPSSDLEEGFDNIYLTCNVDSNPPATVMWRKRGNSDVIATTSKMGFYPLLRKNSGVYTCEAINAVGTSNVAVVEVDVKYAPVNVTIQGPFIAELGNSFTLQCLVDSNPPSDVRFFQKINSIPETSVLRGEGNTLTVTNVSYLDQGEYHCAATNRINGNEGIVKSSAKILRVTGPPQFYYGQKSSRFVFNRNTDAVIQVEFCGDPAPTKLLWKSKGLSLEPGDVFYDAKFLAEPLRQVGSTSCYEARLLIQQIDLNDANSYELYIENDKGSATGSFMVHVREPVPMTAVVGVIAGCLLFLVFITLCLLYAFRSDRWCFRGEDSEKAQPDVCASAEVKLRKGYISREVAGSPAKIRQPNANLRYSDLMLPRASNNGSMRVKKGQFPSSLPSVTPIPSPQHARSPSRQPEDMLTSI